MHLMRSSWFEIDTLKAKVDYLFMWNYVNLPYKRDFIENKHTFQHALFMINYYLVTRNIHVCLGILLISIFMKICTPFIGSKSTENIAIFLKNKKN
jgi:hypothetical protein